MPLDPGALCISWPADRRRPTNGDVAMLKHAPAARAEMLIRRPVADVFEAFVDPSVTSKFWFTGGSGRLETGRRVTWDWDMYGFSVPVDVKVIEPNKQILIEWLPGGSRTSVEWVFKSRADNTTFVSITNTGFTGDEYEIVKSAVDSTEGFAFVLAGAKAYLEHGVILNLVRDRFPDGLGKG